MKRYGPWNILCNNLSFLHSQAFPFVPGNYSSTRKKWRAQPFQNNIYYGHRHPSWLRMNIWNSEEYFCCSHFFICPFPWSYLGNKSHSCALEVCEKFSNVYWIDSIHPPPFISILPEKRCWYGGKDPHIEPHSHDFNTDFLLWGGVARNGCDIPAASFVSE